MQQALIDIAVEQTLQLSEANNMLLELIRRGVLEPKEAKR
jgi:hypothetical protein